MYFIITDKKSYQQNNYTVTISNKDYKNKSINELKELYIEKVKNLLEKELLTKLKNEKMYIEKILSDNGKIYAE